MRMRVYSSVYSKSRQEIRELVSCFPSPQRRAWQSGMMLSKQKCKNKNGYHLTSAPQTHFFISAKSPSNSLSLHLANELPA